MTEKSSSEDIAIIREKLEKNRRFGNVTQSGVVFDEELAGRGGMSFLLLREEGTTDEMISFARAQIHRERDVVGPIKITAVIPNSELSVKSRPIRDQALSAIQQFLAVNLGERNPIDHLIPFLEEDGLYSWAFRLQESDPISHLHGGSMNIEWHGTGVELGEHQAEPRDRRYRE